MLHTHFPTVQWGIGVVNTTVTLPVAFNNSGLCGIATSTTLDPALAGTWAVSVNAVSLSTVTVGPCFDSAGHIISGTKVFWFVIGY